MVRGLGQIIDNKAAWWVKVRVSDGDVELHQIITFSPLARLFRHILKV